MRTTSVLLATLLLAASSITLNSCGKSGEEKPTIDTMINAQTPAKEGQGRGVVLSIDSARKSVELSHNDIPGIMDAMSMDYRIERPELLDRVAKGDSVTFTLKEPQAGDYVVTAITVLPKK